MLVSADHATPHTVPQGDPRARVRGRAFFCSPPDACRERKAPGGRARSRGLKCRSCGRAPTGASRRSALTALPGRA